MKIFANDLENFLHLLETKVPFSVTRFGDGEMCILQNKKIDLLKKGNGEFKYNPEYEADKEFKQMLHDSFMFKAKNYYVGIGCPCCIGKDSFEWMRSNSKQKEEALTWANIWVNSNYKTFIDKIVPSFNEYKINMICNKKSEFDNLSFNKKIKYDWRVGSNAWIEDLHLIKEIRDYIEHNKIQGELFLFSSGPHGNMLIYKLSKMFPDNTYLNIGSTLDPFLFKGVSGLTRGYHRGSTTLKKICRWDNI